MGKNVWNAELYNRKHNFVSEYGESLVSLLNPQPTDTILDLGCGTGTLTGQIAEKAAKVVGIDASASMIAKAQSDFPQLTFLVADGHNFDLGTEFDAVFSNAALHWMLEPKQVIGCVWAALKPNGRFILEMGGKGNIETIERASEYALSRLGVTPPPQINYFPSISEYSQLLEQQGFKVDCAYLFERPTALEGHDGLRNWLKMFRSHILHKLDQSQVEAYFGYVEEFARKELQQSDSGWIADYVRLKISTHKPALL